MAAFNVTESCLAKAISIVNNSSGSISSYNWQSSTGQNFTGSNPLFVFNTHGNYASQLKVQTAFGCNDSISKPIVINAAKLLPLAIPAYL